MSVVEHNRILNERYLAQFRSLIPDELYHITPLDRVRDIIHNGILINQPRSSTDGYIFGVYLSSDPEFLYEIGEYKKSDTAIIEVSTKQLISDLYIDSEFYSNDPESDDSFLEYIIAGYSIISAYTTQSIGKEHIIRIMA